MKKILKPDEILDILGANDFLKIDVPKGKVALIIVVDDTLPSGRPSDEDIGNLLSTNPRVYDGSFCRGCVLFYQPIPLEVFELEDTRVDR